MASKKNCVKVDKELNLRDRFESYGHENSDDNDSANTAYKTTSTYVAPNALEWKNDPLVKNKIQPHNIIRCAPCLPKKHIAATAKEVFCLFVTESEAYLQNKKKAMELPALCILCIACICRS